MRRLSALRVLRGSRDSDAGYEAADLDRVADIAVHARPRLAPVGDLAYVERYKVLLPLFIPFRSDRNVDGITPEQQREVRIIDHLVFSVRDLAQWKEFFTAALAPLGIGVVTEVTAEQTGGSPM